MASKASRDERLARMLGLDPAAVGRLWARMRLHYGGRMGSLPDLCAWLREDLENRGRRLGEHVLVALRAPEVAESDEVDEALAACAARHDEWVEQQRIEALRRRPVRPPDLPMPPLTPQEQLEALRRRADAAGTTAVDAELAAREDERQDAQQALVQAEVES